MTGPEAAGVLHPLRPTPGAVRSATFALTVEGRDVPVEDWRDLSYARFAFTGRVRVVVEHAEGHAATTSAGAPGAAPGWRVRPDRAGVQHAPTPSGALEITVDRPRMLVVDTGGRRLLLFAEAAETDVPDPRDPGVTGIGSLGVTGDGTATQTDRIQAALDRVGDAGGGVLHVPPGVYRTGTIRVPSRVTLYLADGVLLQGAGDPADHPVDPGRVEGPTTYGEHFIFSRLIHFHEVHQAGLAGRGVVDGDGGRLRAAGRNSNLVRVSRSRDVVLRDVLLRDAAAWNTHLLDSHRVRVRGVRILNDMAVPNTDGVDVDSCTEVAVDGVFVHGGDDAVCIKATGNGTPGGSAGPVGDVRAVTVSNGLYITDDAAMKVGTESSAALLADIRFLDNDVVDSDRAMSLVVRDGASYARISFAGVTTDGVAHLVEQSIQLRAGYDRQPGTMAGITFRDIVADGYHPRDNRTSYRPDGGPVICGYDEDHPVHGVRFANVVVNGQRLDDLAGAWEHARIDVGPHVRDVRFE